MDQQNVSNLAGIVRAYLTHKASTDEERDELLTAMLIVSYPRRDSQDN